MADNRPIGVFDSGLGGLTSVKELLKVLPGEDIVFFGDTARMPYGVHNQETLTRYTEDDIAFLLTHGVKMLLAACGTVSSNYPAALAAKLPVPYTGVIEPTANAAIAATKTGKVGLIATNATVNSGVFPRLFAEKAPHITLTSNGCPDLVTLIEGGHIAPDDEAILEAAARYLAPIQVAGVDTLVLACTHFPLIAGILQEMMGPGVTLISAGQEAAKVVAETLKEQGLAAEEGHTGKTEFYVSARPAGFASIAKIFLGTESEIEVEQVTLPASTQKTT